MSSLLVAMESGVGEEKPGVGALLGDELESIGGVDSKSSPLPGRKGKVYIYPLYMPEGILKTGWSLTGSWIRKWINPRGRWRPAYIYHLQAGRDAQTDQSHEPLSLKALSAATLLDEKQPTLKGGHRSYIYTKDRCPQRSLNWWVWQCYSAGRRHLINDFGHAAISGARQSLDLGLVKISQNF